MVKPSIVLAFGSLAGLSLVACSAAVSDDASSNAVNDAIGTSGTVITAPQVARLRSFDGVTPPVNTADPAHKPTDYLSRWSALGPVGPLGAWGPLGALGPVGDNTWNPSTWMNAAHDWNLWRSKALGAAKGESGPLGEAGSLGPNGPLGEEAYGTRIA